MKALSLDLRQRIIKALESGQARQEVAQRFDVSLSSVGRLKRQWKEEGRLEAKPIPGRSRAIESEEEKQTIQRLIKEQPDPTLSSLSSAFEQEVGKYVSKSALQRNLRWLGQSYKKRAVSPKNATNASGQSSEKP